MTITRLHVGPRMSQVVVHGDTIYLAGQVAENPAGQTVGQQTKAILAGIDALLAEAGSVLRESRGPCGRTALLSRPFSSRTAQESRPTRKNPRESRRTACYFLPLE